MLEPLWDEPQDDPRASGELAAARAIHAARVTYIEDLDKLEATMRAGGGFLEMRAAVDAYQVLSNVARELDAVAKRAVAPEPMRPADANAVSEPTASSIDTPIWLATRPDWFKA